MPSSSPHLPTPKDLSGQMPAFIPAKTDQIESQAVGLDQQAYGLSDADFRQRYPQLYQTQQTFLNNLQSQMSGNVSPQMQNLWTRSGLTGALGATGNWSLGTGTTGMANVARNLGVNQMGYQQQLLQQFQTANDTFRPRTFGLSGADAAQIALSNVAGQNNWNQAQFAYRVQESQFATNLQAQQAMASANAQNATTGNLVGAGSSILGAVATVAFCWLARSAYGPYNRRWHRFRWWMLTVAPGSLRGFYGRFGPSLAGWLEAHSQFKPLVRWLMELITWRFQYATLPF